MPRRMPRRGPESSVVKQFVQRLAAEYSYPEGCIQYDPQYTIPASPSGGEYPLDIAVFKTSGLLALDYLFLIVETKPSIREEGERQVKDYLRMCPAEIGVWFNGEDHAYWRKIITSGRLEFSEIPDIPRYGQKVQDIGRFRRKDLRVPRDLKAFFREIRNHLAGHTRNITRDQDLATDIINILFCKIYDELHTPLDKDVEFRAGSEEPSSELATRISRFFEERVKREFHDIFDPEAHIRLDEDSLAYVVGSLQNYTITDPAVPRDAIADAFEVFIGPALRGEEGQFFTPRNVITMMVGFLNPKPNETLIDPACGSGGFLVETLRFLWFALEEEARRCGWDRELLIRKKWELANACLRGIDKDAFLQKVARAYMALLGNGREMVFCENSLSPPSQWAPSSQMKVKLGDFNVAVTNPPHGSKVRMRGLSVTQQYDVARRWWWNSHSNTWIGGIHREREAVPVLFLERCYQLIKDGGRLGIVFPETYLGMPQYQYVPAWLLRYMTVKAVISLPEELFQPYTHNKVCVIIAEKRPPSKDDPIVMGITRRCGHDSRGLPIPYDDIPIVHTLVKKLLEQNSSSSSNKVFSQDGALAFVVLRKQIRNDILVPKYYDPRVAEEAKALSPYLDLIPLGDLINRGSITAKAGVEVGKLAYGTGDIPFVRTSDLSTWEIKIDPKQGISEDIYARYAKKASISPGDLLLVRDGTYLVGTVAIVTEHDPPRMLIPGGILCLRMTGKGKREKLNPYLLLAALTSPFVKRQIRSKQFTRGVIDTLGKRYHELLLPFPKGSNERARLAREVKEIVKKRAELKEKIPQLLGPLAQASKVLEE